MDQLETINRQLFTSLNATEAAPATLLHLAHFLAQDLIFFLPLLLAVLWCRGNEASRSLCLKAVGVTLLSLGVNGLIHRLCYHPRPFAINFGHTYLSHAPDASFPSDHATIFAAVGFALLGAETRRWGAGVLMAGIGVAWARIFLGVHWPLDMIGAVLVAGVVCAILSPPWRKYGGKITACLSGAVCAALSCLPVCKKDTEK